MYRKVIVSTRRSFSSLKDTDVVVCGLARTPIGKIGGALSSITAPRLGAHAITAALSRSGLDGKYIEEAFMVSSFDIYSLFLPSLFRIYFFFFL
jgi:hypothetical protein